jgi:hypothetical protein
VAGSGAQRSLICWRDGQVELQQHCSEAEPEDLRNGSYQEVVEFVEALKAGTSPGPTVEDILPSAQLCFSIADAAARLIEAKA